MHYRQSARGRADHRVCGGAGGDSRILRAKWRGREHKNPGEEQLLHEAISGVKVALVGGCPEGRAASVRSNAVIPKCNTFHLFRSSPGGSSLSFREKDWQRAL